MTYSLIIDNGNPIKYSSLDSFTVGDTLTVIFVPFIVTHITGNTIHVKTIKK